MTRITLGFLSHHRLPGQNVNPNAVLSDAGDIYDLHTSSIREICSKYYKQEEICAWISRQNKERYLEHIANEEIVVLQRKNENDVKELVGFGHLSGPYCDHGNRLHVADEEQGGWDKAFVRALYVHPSHLTKGIGQQLLNHMQTLKQ